MVAGRIGLTAGLVLVLVLALVLGSEPTAAAEVPLDEARSRLEKLTRLLRRSDARNSDLVALLRGVAKDESRGGLERAYALIALGRMADREADPWLTRFGRDFNPYTNSSPVLTGLARFTDTPFLRR